MTTKTKLVKRQSSVLLPERDIDKSPVLECVGLGVTFGGLKAGQVVFLGSVTPPIWLDGPCSAVVEFDTLGRVELTLT